MAFDSLEPPEGVKQDYRFSTLYSVLTNLFRAAYSKRGHAKMTKPGEFSFSWEPKRKSKAPKKQTVNEMKGALTSIFQIFKGKGKGIAKEK